MIWFNLEEIENQQQYFETDKHGDTENMIVTFDKQLNDILNLNNNDIIEYILTDATTNT